MKSNFDDQEKSATTNKPDHSLCHPTNKYHSEHF